MTASLVFVGFQKAFDNFHRSSIPVILSQYNVQTLSLYLFIVLLDYALVSTLQDDVGFVFCKWNGRRHPAIHIGVLAYADNICLLVESIDDVKCSLHRLESFAAEIGLTINHNKTKAMHLGQVSVRHVRYANGVPVDSCDKFEYLGVPTSNVKTVF